MDSGIVEVSNLTKVYGSLTAINGISFSVRKGEIFGLLGPNGAGKTTALECLEGLRQPDSGTMRIRGTDPITNPKKLRSLIGVQLQSSALPGTMRVDEAMKLFSAYHKIAPCYDLLERMGLAQKLKAQYNTLSTGQKRRLALALAVAHQPPVVFLDEPTAGLDVATRAELHRLMNELREEGTTLILSTHDMAEAEEMADRVAILLQGEIVTCGSPRQLTATGEGLTKISVYASGTNFSALLLPEVIRHTTQENYWTYYTTETGEVVSSIISHIKNSGGTLMDLRVERPSLEERFLELTSKEVVA